MHGHGHHPPSVFLPLTGLEGGAQDVLLDFLLQLSRGQGSSSSSIIIIGEKDGRKKKPLTSWRHQTILHFQKTRPWDGRQRSHDALRPNKLHYPLASDGGEAVDKVEGKRAGLSPVKIPSAHARVQMYQK
jgi:hypothetical protein